MNTSRTRLGGAGTQNASLAFGGLVPPATYQSATEEWDLNVYSNKITIT
jgi:hypothetical protein